MARRIPSASAVASQQGERVRIGFMTLAAFAFLWSGPGQGGAGQAGAAARDVAVTPIAGVIGAGAAWRIAWQGTDNADGLVGTPDGGVLFAQEQPSRVRKLDKDDVVSVYAENTGGAGSLALDAMGRLFAAQRTCTDPGLNRPCSEPTRIAIIHPPQERRVLAEAFEGKPLGRLNDLVVSRQGVVHFTSGGAYSTLAGGRVVSIGENLRTNGIMLSPDERTLYVTNGTAVVAFDVQPDGSARNQREFARLEAGGSGDGMAIDAAGRLYVTAQQAGVQVFSPEGKHLGVIPTPRNAISITFSGPDRKTLYVVGSGALGADGKEATTAPGVRNNAKTIYRIPMLAEGFTGRAK
jgi:gluconolactonase